MARARWLLLGAALLATSTARAQSGSDVTTAQALFEEGKRLMQDKHFAEACPKLVESQQLDPGGGTLLAIALCHEGEGRLATAWGDFNLAASEARKDHRTDRETAALGHVRALEPRLTRARIVVAMGVPGLQISRDEKPVGSAELGTPLPIDAGDHTFEARAPGKETWHKTITIAGEGKTVDVTVPILEDEPKPPSVAPAPVPTAPSAPPPPRRRRSPRRSRLHPRRARLLRPLRHHRVTAVRRCAQPASSRAGYLSRWPPSASGSARARSRRGIKPTPGATGRCARTRTHRRRARAPSTRQTLPRCWWAWGARGSPCRRS